MFILGFGLLFQLQILKSMSCLCIVLYFVVLNFSAMLSVGRTYRAENLFRMHWPKRRGKIQKYETENYKILQLSASGREQIEQQQELFASEDSGENAPNTSRQKIETSQIRVEQIMLTSLILVWTLTPMCCLFSWSATLFSYTTCFIS